MHLSNETLRVIADWKGLYYKGCPLCGQLETIDSVVGFPDTSSGQLSPDGRFVPAVLFTCKSCGHMTHVSPLIAMKDAKPHHPPTEDV